MIRVWRKGKMGWVHTADFPSPGEALRWFEGVPEIKGNVKVHWICGSTVRGQWEGNPLHVCEEVRLITAGAVAGRV